VTAHEISEYLAPLRDQFADPRSLVLPALKYAQTDSGWLPPESMAAVAEATGFSQAYIESVATFYDRLYVDKVGRRVISVCVTLSCMLRGSDDIMSACKKRGMVKGGISADGLWTLTEVECMGNCATAPMVQINDDNYEDLTPERLDAVLDALARGETPKAGTQEPGRHTSEPTGGPTTLTDMVGANHDYRGEW
jgi:NADH-quinone oxidoreductase subunit E